MARLPDIDKDRVTSLLQQAAEEIVLPRYKALDDHEIMEKGVGDVVTVADLEAEHFLTNALSALLPGSLVVGEEAHAKHPEILRRFEDKDPVWVIDPVDGTRNFTKGKQTFCMLVALSVGNQPVMGWIHDPTTGRTAVAEEGAGAFINGERLKTPDAPPDAEMIGQLNTGFFEEEDRHHVRRESRARFAKVESLSCAGHDFLAQSLGERHFSFYRRLWPWDHVAGVLTLREAGGMVERVDGGPYRAGDRVHGLLATSDRASWSPFRLFLNQWPWL